MRSLVSPKFLFLAFGMSLFASPSAFSDSEKVTAEALKNIRAEVIKSTMSKDPDSPKYQDAFIALAQKRFGEIQGDLVSLAYLADFSLRKPESLKRVLTQLEEDSADLEKELPTADKEEGAYLNALAGHRLPMMRYQCYLKDEKEAEKFLGTATADGLAFVARAEKLKDVDATTKKALAIKKKWLKWIQDNKPEFRKAMVETRKFYLSKAE